MLFYFCQKYVGIILGKESLHSGALSLLIIFTIKGKIILLENQNQNLFDLFYLQQSGFPIMNFDCMEAKPLNLRNVCV